jgi:hypothetical protein
VFGPEELEKFFGAAKPGGLNITTWSNKPLAKAHSRPKS